MPHRQGLALVPCHAQSLADSSLVKVWSLCEHYGGFTRMVTGLSSAMLPAAISLDGDWAAHFHCCHSLPLVPHRSIPPRQWSLRTLVSVASTPFATWFLNPWILLLEIQHTIDTHGLICILNSEGTSSFRILPPSRCFTCVSSWVF